MNIDWSSTAIQWRGHELLVRYLPSTPPETARGVARSLLDHGKIPVGEVPDGAVTAVALSRVGAVTYRGHFGFCAVGFVGNTLYVGPVWRQASIDFHSYT